MMPRKQPTMNEFDFEETEKAASQADEHSSEDLLNRVLKEAGNSIFELLELLKAPEKELQQKAKELALKVADGKLSKEDEQELQFSVRSAHFGGNLKQLEKAINKQLRDLGSEHRMEIDDFLANVQDIGSISIAVKNSDGKVVCGTHVTINNSPQIPRVIEFPPVKPEPKPGDLEPPLIIPRLDIPEYPGRKWR